jgi:hypothetical protein
MTSKLVLGAAVAVLMTFLMPASEALAVCCGSNCCCIDDATQGPGDTNPSNECQVCDPSTSQREWTDVAGCSADEDAGVADEDMGTPVEEDMFTPADEDMFTPAEDDMGTSSDPDGGPTGDDSGSDDDGGCAAGGSGAFGGLFGLLILGLRRKKELQ